MLYYQAMEDELYLFEDEAEQLEAYRDYGYIPTKGLAIKPLYYKLNATQFQRCEVIGYFIPKAKKHRVSCLVINLDGQRGLVHRDCLKDMQEAQKQWAKSTNSPSS